MTVNIATIRKITVANSPAQFVNANTERVEERAEQIRVDIRDHMLGRQAPRVSTLRHYAGLIKTLADRGVADCERHGAWLAAFKATAHMS